MMTQRKPGPKTAPIAKTIKASLFSLGHYARRLKRDQFPGVLVLCYHGLRADEWPDGSMPFEELHVRASEFAAHCRLLKKTCHPISLDDWRRALAGERALPERPVLLTFDDGYRSVYTLARPILEEYDIPAVFFICSEPVEQRQTFWYDGLALQNGEGVVEQAKYLDHDEWQQRRPGWLKSVGDDDPHAPLTIGEVRALAQWPGFEIGAHTAIHSILACATAARQRAELFRNKSMLERWLERPVRAFAYPNGQPGKDYTSETVELVKETGFDLAFTTNYGFAKAREGLLELSRFIMLTGISAAELAHCICYSWRKGQRVSKG